jgi:hypothetical protein
MAVTINGSTGFAFPDGSASAPSIAHYGDANCGLYFPTADSIAAVTNGIAALTINSSQVVTLANALPVGSGGTGLNTLTAGYIPYGNGTSGFSSSANLYFSGTSLGIGTVSPTYNLDVVANINGNGFARVTNANAGASALGGFLASNGTANCYFGTTGTGYTTYGVLAANDAFQYSTGNISFGADGSGVIKFGTGTSVPERMRIDSSGNVGIGNGAFNTLDQIGSSRPLCVSASSASTTIAGSTACITIANSNTTTNNTSQLLFATGTGSANTFFGSAAISCVFGARTSGQYPTGQLVFSTSTTLNTAPTQKMVLDNAGNLGLGVTPSAGYGALQVTTGTNGTAAYLGNGAGVHAFNSSGYFSSAITLSSAGIWTARSSAAGMIATQNGGAIQFFTDTGLTPGNTFSPTPRVTLDASGNLLVNGNATGGKIGLTNTPSTEWGIFFNTSLVIANGANSAFSAGSGLLLVTEAGVNGATAIYIVGGGQVTLVSTTNAGFWDNGTTTPAAGKASIGYSGSAYTLYNNQGASRTFYIAMLRTRPSN